MRDIIAKLEQMVAEGKKVVSLDFMIKELRGIPPTFRTRHQIALEPTST